MTPHGPYAEAAPWMRGRRARHRRAWVLACVVALLAAMDDGRAQQGQSAEADQVSESQGAPRLAGGTALSLRGGYGHSDNIGRDARGRSSSFQFVGADVDWGRTSQRVDAQVSGDLALYRYSASQLLDDNTQTWGSLDSRLNLGLVEQRLTWAFSQHYGQTRQNPLRPIGPRNRDTFTVFSTGPRLTVPISGRTGLDAGATLSQRSSKFREDVDGRTISARVGVFHALSPVSQVSLSYATAENRFDGPFPRYEIENVTLEYEKTLASGRVDASVGQGTLHWAGQSNRTGIASIAWSRRVASRTTLRTWATRELTDAGQLFQSGGGRGGRSGSLFNRLGNIGIENTITGLRWRDIVLTPNPLTRTSGGVGARYAGDRTSWSASVGISENRFEAISAFDSDGAYAAFSVDRDLAARWQGTIRANLWWEEFAVLDATFDNMSIMARATRSFGRRMDLHLSLERSERGTGVGAFSENAFLASVRYRLGE